MTEQQSFLSFQANSDDVELYDLFSGPVTQLTQHHKTLWLQITIVQEIMPGQNGKIGEPALFASTPKRGMNKRVLLHLLTRVK